MHPGTPPSRRRSSWSGDWRERLRVTTQSLATKMRDTFGFDDPSTRRILIAAVRLALGESSTAEIAAGSESDDETGGAIAVTARAYRIILEGDGIDRDDPLVAESFMVVVERSLDDLGLGWRSKIRKATQIVAASLRRACDDATIREKMMEAAREALGEDPDAVMVKMMEVPSGDVDPPRVEECMSAAGIFRMILVAQGLDRRDPLLAESFMAEVAAVLDAELSGE